MEYFNYGIDSYMPCEICGKRAVDIHYIHGRGKGKDVIENLMGLCRYDHDKVHKKLNKDVVQFIHNNFLKTFTK